MKKTLSQIIITIILLITLIQIVNAVDEGCTPGSAEIQPQSVVSGGVTSEKLVEVTSDEGRIEVSVGVTLDDYLIDTLSLNKEDGSGLTYSNDNIIVTVDSKGQVTSISDINDLANPDTTNEVSANTNFAVGETVGDTGPAGYSRISEYGADSVVYQDSSGNTIIVNANTNKIESVSYVKSQDTTTQPNKDSSTPGAGDKGTDLQGNEVTFDSTQNRWEDSLGQEVPTNEVTVSKNTQTPAQTGKSPTLVAGDKGTDLQGNEVTFDAAQNRWEDSLGQEVPDNEVTVSKNTQTQEGASASISAGGTVGSTSLGGTAGSNVNDPKTGINSYSALSNIVTYEGVSYYYDKTDGTYKDINNVPLDNEKVKAVKSASDSTFTTDSSLYKYYSSIVYGGTSLDVKTDAKGVTKYYGVKGSKCENGCTKEEAEKEYGAATAGTVDNAQGLSAAIDAKLTSKTSEIKAAEAKLNTLQSDPNAKPEDVAKAKADLEKLEKEKEELEKDKTEINSKKKEIQNKIDHDITAEYKAQILSQGAVSYLSDAGSAFGDLGDLLGVGGRLFNTDFVDSVFTMEGIADTFGACSKDILSSKSSTTSFVVLPDGTQAMHIEGYTRSYSGYVACDYANNDSTACTQAFSSSTKCSEEGLCGTKDNPSLFTDTVYFVTAEISSSMGEDVKFQLTLDNTVIDLDDYWTNGTWKIDADDTKKLNTSYSWKGSSALYIPGSKIGGGSHSQACIKILNPGEIDDDAKEVWEQVEEGGKLCNDFVKPLGNELLCDVYTDKGGLTWFAWGITQGEFDICQPLE